MGCKLAARILEAKRRANHECLRCGAVMAGDRKALTCISCMAKRSAITKAYRERNVKKGKCPLCGLPPAKKWQTGGGKLCVTCAKIRRGWKQKQKQNNRCVSCGGELGPKSTIYCEGHRLDSMRRNSFRRLKNRPDKLGELFGIEISNLE